MTVTDAPKVRIPRGMGGGAGLGVRGRLRYWRRVLSAYTGGRASHLTFWHGAPEWHDAASPGELGPYWQRFAVKADYPGPRDEAGIPLLDYHGHVGLQYNPIAIAQYGLGNLNLWRETDDPERRVRALAAADWLVDHLEPNEAGVPVWKHHFRWEYQTLLPSGWYSALAQGQGISLLVRAHRWTGDARYLAAAEAALVSFGLELEEGGVSHTDADGLLWFEEVVVDPPTHILNGFLWAAWGVYDLALHTGSPDARRLFDAAVRTLRARLDRFDVGYWSLYDRAGTAVPNAASPFYHALHVVQLRVMERLVGDGLFGRWADRWDGFQRSGLRRRLAWGHKALFKVLYY